MTVRPAVLTGLALALALTAIPFGVVHFRLLAGAPALWVIALAGAAQVFVHLRWFLGLDLRHSPREQLLALAFAGLLVLLMVGGSVWIMADLHQRMMP